MLSWQLILTRTDTVILTRRSGPCSHSQSFHCVICKWVCTCFWATHKSITLPFPIPSSDTGQAGVCFPGPYDFPILSRTFPVDLHGDAAACPPCSRLSTMQPLVHHAAACAPCSCLQMACPSLFSPSSPFFQRLPRLTVCRLCCFLLSFKSLVRVFLIFFWVHF